MDWSNPVTLLSLGSTGFALTVMLFCLRLVYTSQQGTLLADARLDDEVEAHKATRLERDAEREKRVEAEDAMRELKWEVRGLRAELAALKARVGELEQST